MDLTLLANLPVLLAAPPVLVHLLYSGESGPVPARPFAAAALQDRRQ